MLDESLSTRLQRWRFNWFPAYRRSGARIEHIAADWHYVRVRLPLNWTTRNYVGTTFGGSMYAAVDPIYMMMLIMCLGRRYIVWDKAAEIRFRRPGRDTLYAEFQLDDKELTTIRTLLEDSPRIDRHYAVELCDASGAVHAEFDKTVHLRRRNLAPEERPGEKTAGQDAMRD
jgi:acyl-coenzyme A thioesterase PaaI-like protein